MKPRTVVTIVLLAFVAASVAVLVAKEMQRPGGGPTDGGPAAPLADGVVATYFHRAKRCPACITIEKLSRDAVEGAFAGDIAAGRLAFRIVNLDDPGNERYATDYDLVSNSLVLAAYAGGKQTRWKNLPEIWDRYGNRGNFLDYVYRELSVFMEAK